MLNLSYTLALYLDLNELEVRRLGLSGLDYITEKFQLNFGTNPPVDPNPDFFKIRQHWNTMEHFFTVWCPSAFVFKVRSDSEACVLQVTWAKTTHVGCGFAKCGMLQNVGYQNGIYMVCNYGPWSVHDSSQVLLKRYSDFENRHRRSQGYNGSPGREQKNAGLI